MKKNKLKICTVSSFDSTHIRDRMLGIQSLGHQVDFFIANPQKKFKQYFELYNYLKNEKPNILHIHFAGGPLAAAACLWAQCPIITTIMGGDILFKEQPHPTYSSIELSKQILSCTDAFTVKSFFLKDELLKVFPNTKEIIRVLWGIDTRLFRPNILSDELRTKLGFDQNDFIIFSPKGLHPLYNTEILIKSFAEVCKEKSNVKLLLSEMGADPAYQKKLYELRDSTNLNCKIVFAGHISHQEMPMYYNLSDIVVNIPSSDGLPQSLFEAMACGTPCILSRLERYQEVIEDHQHALFVDQTSVSDLKEKILQLLFQAELYNKLAQNALQKVHVIADRTTELQQVEKLYYSTLNEQKNKKTKLTTKAMLFSFIITHYGERIFQSND